MGPETADPLVALDDLTDPIPTPEAFATTYGGYKVGPWEAVRQYRRVKAAEAAHPEKGSGALSSVVDLPRSRIRS